MAQTEEEPKDSAAARSPPAAAESGAADGIWQQLKKHVSTLASGDELKAKPCDVASLSTFLFLVTEEMSHKSTFSHLQSVVPLWTEDVMLLNACLCRELAKYTRFLFSEHGLDTSDVLVVSTEVTKQTLRCCIRILPLIDCCNTGLSAQCAASLKCILQQLCSPSTLHNIRVASLSVTGVQGRPQDSHSKCSGYETPGFTGVSGAELPHMHFMRVVQNDDAFQKLRVEDLWKESSGYEELMKRSFLGKDAECDLDAHGQDKDAYLPRVLDHKVDIICGMLEVYMDELLSHPDLSEVFLWTQDEADKGVLSFSRQMEIVLEAACAHALVSRRRTGRVRRAELPVGSPPLTLTAAVLLLDLVVEDGAHQEFLTHVADLVRRSVDELDVVLWRRSSQVMNEGGGIFEGSTSEDSTQTTWVADCDEMPKLVDVVDPTKTLDWLKGDTSWPSQQSPDLAERLHPRLSVHLTLSILESAVRLYAQADVSSCLHQRNAWDGKKGSARSSSCGCSFSSDLKQTDGLFCSPVHVQRDVHSLGNLLNGLRDSSTLNSNQQQEFVAAMLHLMSSSLYRIAAELRRMRQLSATNDPLGTELEREIGITVSCVSAVFRSSLAGAQQIPPAVKNLFSDRLEESSAEDLKESIRFTWKILSDVVRREVKEGVADHLLDEYFHVLKSLLVLVREGDRHADPKDGHCIDIDQIARSQQFESIAAEPDEESRVLTGFGRTLNSGLATPANPGNQMSPATLRIFQKLKGRKPQTSTPESGRSSDMDPNKVCDQIVSSLSSTLSSQERSNKRSRVSRDISSVSTGVNPYVQSCIASDKSMDGDTFEDLNDFIVCKEGRNYVKWKKERQKFVARRRARNIWKRMEEREKLLAKLALTETE